MGGSVSRKQSDVYEYDKNLEPGVAYIFNHIEFDPRIRDNKICTPSKRTGSIQDEIKLTETFKFLGIQETKVIRNATVNEIKETMELLKTTDFSKKAFLLIVIMTHGDRYNVLTAKDGYYLYDNNILFNLYQNKSLNNVTKILFVQACRQNFDKPLVRDSVYEPFNIETALPDHYFTLFSCAEGFPSWRSELSGSFFIQAVCNNLQKYGLTRNINDICDEVIEDVKKESKKKRIEEKDQIQIPEVRKNLTRRFVFGHYIKKEIPMHLTKEYQDELDYNIAMSRIESFVN